MSVGAAHICDGKHAVTELYIGAQQDAMSVGTVPIDVVPTSYLKCSTHM